ncbi:PB1 domain-containing protein, partial [Tanacetum coccineum]
LLYWLNLRFDYVPDKTLCGFVFNELVNDNAAKAAKKFIEFTGFVPENGSLELYVKCLCENGMVEDALHVFDEMKKDVNYPSLETWNSVLRACVKAGWTDIVWELYDEMMELGVETVDCLIRAFCLDGNVTKGYEVLRQMLDDGYVPNKVVFDNLLFEFILDRKYSRVSALLHIMIAKGVDSDLYTYQQIKHGLCLRRMQHEGLRIFNDLKDRGITEAFELFKQMGQKNVPRDVVTFNCMIRGLCKEGRISEGLNLLHELVEQGLQPSSASYGSLIEKLYEMKRIDEVKNLWNEMQEKGVEPASVCIDGDIIIELSKKGYVAAGVYWLAYMVKNRLIPRKQTFENLIGVLSQMNKLDVGLIAFGHMFKIGYIPSLRLEVNRLRRQTRVCSTVLFHSGRHVFFSQSVGKYGEDSKLIYDLADQVVTEPRWKGKGSKVKALANPISRSILDLQSSLQKSSSRGILCGDSVLLVCRKRARRPRPTKADGSDQEIDEFVGPSALAIIDDDVSIETVVSVWKSAISGVGQEFSNVSDFRQALQRYAMANGFEYKLKKNDTNRANGVCTGEDCSWKFNAVWVPTTESFKMKTMNNVHTCDLESRVNSLVITLNEKLQESPHLKPKEIANQLLKDSGVDLNHGTMAVKDERLGSDKESYNLLPWFCDKIIETNPGSISKLIVGENKRFKAPYCVFKRTLYGFQNSCRPLLFLEATSLRSMYGEVLLTANAIDGNDDFFPVAFAIVDVEDDNNCRWFLEQLKAAILYSQPMTFVFDMEKNLKTSVFEVFQDAHVTHAVRLAGFRKSIEQIKLISSQAYDWVMQIEPQHWASSSFKGERYNHITDDVGGSLAKLMEDYQESSILHKIDALLRTMIDAITDAKLDAWWKEIGLPCRHSLAVFALIGRNPDEYCANYFTVDAYRLTYLESINQNASIDVWYTLVLLACSGSLLLGRAEHGPKTGPD